MPRFCLHIFICLLAIFICSLCYISIQITNFIAWADKATLLHQLPMSHQGLFFPPGVLAPGTGVGICSSSLPSYLLITCVSSPNPSLNCPPLSTSVTILTFCLIISRSDYSIPSPYPFSYLLFLLTLLIKMND